MATQNTNNNSTVRLDKRKLGVRRLVAFALPILVIVGAIVAVNVMGAMKPKPEKKVEEVKALPVVTATAVSDQITLKVTAQGEVQPRSQINLVPQVSGKLTYMSPKFIEGGAFKKGDLLVRVEPAEYELRVVQAKANVAQAETVIMREKSESEIALRDWQELGNGGAPSALTLREPQMAEAAARLESAKAQLAEAELQLSRTSLHAPFSGRVIRRQVNQGSYVTIGQQIGEIYGTDIVDVKLPLSNQDLASAGLQLGYEAKYGEGIPVTLTANVAGQYAEWSGEIVRTDSRFDPQTRVLFAYVEVQNPFSTKASAAPLAPGIFVTASITGSSIENATVIPRQGLRGDDKVFVARADDTLEIRTVEVRATDRERAMIVAGLEPGEEVIISSIRGAATDMKIDPVRNGKSTKTADAN